MLMAVTIMMALGGCATQAGLREAELQEMLQLLPGHYDNAAQVQSDAQHGVQPPHEALALDIVPIDAPMIADHVLYMQEYVTGDPRRVTAQKVLMLGVVNKDIVETVQTLSDPQRWRNGQLTPELFSSLMVQDVYSVKGCSLRWKRKDSGFAGANDPKTCHGPGRGGGGLAQIDYRAELAPEELALAELAFDAGGHLVLGRQDEPFYRFRKQVKESPGPGD
jgi:hypothetical protein